ncbi:MAG: hypothetical protein IJJ33_09245, partial [Victivallales bacterium]|nr:hypothetical protein [Victivallales bacterium]
MKTISLYYNLSFPFLQSCSSAFDHKFVGRLLAKSPVETILLNKTPSPPMKRGVAAASPPP